MTESLLGLGRKSPRRRWWCDDGRISAARALFTRSPSTPRILTSEFVIADRRALSRFGAYCGGGAAEFLWRLHRNEPGCVVGEHMQVRFWWWLCRLTAWPAPATEMERFGEIEPNRTEGTGAEEPQRLTRVGEVERWKKVVERVEKVEVEDAKAVGEQDAGGGRELRNLAAGESVRRTGPLDFLEAAAI
ncbi:hypothetical protein E2542_SST01786 [Spatholobus suberectus]|nr:hypothetical protein E2542_SST01786 [Spatholobus suberectus]